MPQLKPTDRQLRIASINGLITKYGTLYGYDTSIKISAVIGISRTDYYKKRNNPEKWRIGELDALVRVLHIPKDEFIAALFGV